MIQFTILGEPVTRGKQVPVAKISSKVIDAFIENTFLMSSTY